MKNLRASLVLLLTVWVVLIGAAIPLGAIGWSLHSALTRPDGLSALSGKAMPWDFTNLWLGGRLSLDGRLEVLFDIDAYREVLRGMFAPGMRDSEWSYPPLVLLIGAPMALLPLYPAFLLWTVLGVVLLVGACRMLRLPWAGCAFLLVSPGVLMNALFGQNAALTSALLLAGLWLSRAAPRNSGACFGLLAIKPHLGVLVPVALAASGRWRAMLWSAVWGALLVALSLLFFGVDPWRGFFTITRPLMVGILEAPYGAFYHDSAVTFFAFFRYLGLDLPVAYALQGVVAAGSVAATFLLWRRPTHDPALRCVATGALVLLATPYAFIYDMVLVSVAALFLFVRNGYRVTPLLAVVWIWPAVNFFSANFIAPVAPFVIVLATALCIAELRRVDRPQASPDLGHAPG